MARSKKTPETRSNKLPQQPGHVTQRHHPGEDTRGMTPAELAEHVGTADYPAPRRSAPETHTPADATPDSVEGSGTEQHTAAAGTKPA